MGAVVAAVVTAVTSSFANFSLAGFLSQRLLGGALSFGLSSLSKSVAGRGKATTRRLKDAGLTQTIRESLSERRIIYGTTRVGGTIIAMSTSENQQYLYMAVAIASHSIASFEAIYLNDEPIYQDMIGSDGMVTSGKYQDKLRIDKMLGGDTQTANARMITEIPDWSSDHRLQGIAYIYVRMEYDRQVFSGGIPNISAVIKGKSVFDPRNGQTYYSDNPALCIRDYLTDTRYGRSVEFNAFEDSFFNASANICDEMVATLAIEAPVAFVMTTTNELVLSTEMCPYQTGDRVQLSTTGTLPNGLSTTTHYWVIVTRHKAFVDQTSAETRIALATSLANAQAGVRIDLTSNGTGSHSISKTAEPRYSLNGVVSLDRQPSDILNDMVASLAGRLVYIGGKWRLIAGAWQGVTNGFGDKDMVAPIVVQTRRSRRDRMNAMKGHYAGPQTNYQPTDYPLVRIASYVTEDHNEEIFGQLDLAYTTRSQTAQRIARIALERNRREIACQIEVNLRGLAVQAGDYLYLTHERFGWTNKIFEIVDWTLSTQEQNAVPYLTVRMSLIEVDTAIFSYDFATDELLADIPPRTFLPNALRIETPTNLSVESGNDHLYIRQDGTVFSRLYVTWTPNQGPTDRYEIQYRESSASSWQRPVFASHDQQDIYLLEAQEGQSYEIRLRAIAPSGASSAWVVTAHTVDGKTTPPQTVEQFFANANGSVVYFSWKEVTDRDVAGYEIRYAPIGTTDWESAVIVKLAERGNELTTAAIPPGSWVFFIKAIDTSDNRSVGYASAEATVNNANTMIASMINDPDWVGVKTNMAVHWPTGRLVPLDQSSATTNGFATFDQFLQTPFVLYAYETPELDLGSTIQGTARVWMDVIGGVNPFTTPVSSVFDYDSFLDTRDTGAYDGYEAWDIGERQAFRFAKARFTLADNAVTSYLTRGRLVVDAPPRTETTAIVVTGGSTTITFSQNFLRPPLVRVTYAGTGALIAGVTAVTTTGFTATLVTPLGASASGDVIFDATGV